MHVPVGDTALGDGTMNFVSHRYATVLRAHITDLLKTRPDRPPVPLGVYEKTRIGRILGEINSGRMSLDDAQQAIGVAWMKAYGPVRQPWRSLLRALKSRL